MANTVMKAKINIKKGVEIILIFFARIMLFLTPHFWTIFGKFITKIFNEIDGIKFLKMANTEMKAKTNTTKELVDYFGSLLLLWCYF